MRARGTSAPGKLRGHRARLLRAGPHVLGFQSGYEKRSLEREEGSAAPQSSAAGSRQDARLHGDQGRLRKPPPAHALLGETQAAKCQCVKDGAAKGLAGALCTGLTRKVRLNSQDTSSPGPSPDPGGGRSGLPPGQGERSVLPARSQVGGHTQPLLQCSLHARAEPGLDGSAAPRKPDVVSAGHRSHRA